MKQVVFILFISFILIGCSIKEKQYHPNDNYCEYNNYSLMFLEFKDNGTLHDTCQKNYIIEKVRQIKGKNNIFVFVHGFNHNAEINDEDIKIFKSYLSFMSNENINTTGIYVGWRGKPTILDTYNALFYFDKRKRVSEKIGKNGFKNFLDELKKEKADSKIILIGHSLGAGLIYNSIDNESKKDSFMDYIDLVVLLNPAFEALQYKDLIEYLGTKECNHYENHKPFIYQKPKLIMTTSKKDFRTNVSFEFARGYSSDNNITLLNRKCDLIKHNVGDLNRSTVANYKPFQTHKISVYNDDNITINKNTTISYDLVNATFNNEKWEIPIKELGIKIKHLGNSSISNPYWIIDVDEKIISDHRDINDSRLLSLIRNLIYKKE